VRSSPAYAALALELPPVTVADRLAAALTTVAAGYAAALLAGRGQLALAGLVVLAGALATARQVIRWERSRRGPTLRLERDAGGALQVCAGAAPGVPATLGRGTRRVGSSVFLEVRFASGGRTTRYRRWLTPLDVPATLLRRWSVVLPRSGRAACS
jgi:hypothetical protein